MSRIPELWKPRPFLAALLAAEGLAAVVAFAPGNPGDRWVYFASASCMALWSCTLVAASMYLLRRPLAKASPTVVAWTVAALVAGSLLSAGLVAHWLLLDLASFTAESGFWPRLALTSLTTALFAAAALVAVVRATDAAVASREATLSALKARIRPHFLFNTLNTGAALVHARPGEAERLLMDLADLFRAALSGPEEIPLADEIALTRRYVEIERLRFGDRMRVTWQVPDPVPEAHVPALSLQPLVENAIRHGIEPSPGGGSVEVNVRLAGNDLVIEVRNDLPPASVRTPPGHRVGLTSARERIHALTQGSGRLDTRNEDGRYIATIHIPAPDQPPRTR